VRALAAIITTALLLTACASGPSTAEPPTDSVIAATTAPRLDKQQLALFAGIPEHGTAIGDPKAPVTLLEYLDLQCGACQQLERGVMPALLAEYVRPGVLRVDRRTLSFIGQDSVTAGRMALAAAKQNQMYPFVHLFAYNAGQENSGYVTNEFLTTLGTAVPGLNVQEAVAASSKPDIAAALKANGAAAKQDAVTDTPTLLIGPTGGTLHAFNLRNTADVETLRQAIAAVQAGKLPKSATSPAGGCTVGSTVCTPDP
jgi:protein-disulfide isomerase